MRLWTIQDRTFIAANGAEPIVGDWQKTPENWRHWYAWMAQQWNSRVGIANMSVPLWCWHSCNGVYESCPTVGTFAMLMGDWGYYAPKMMVLELNVPDQVPLLSSYWRWNEAMDDAMDRRSDVIDGSRFADMFDTPLFKHDTDDIQAVIPQIERSWITEKRVLPTSQLRDLDWGLPCTKFPKEPERSDAQQALDRPF